jgi:HEPN domain-containing protein
MKSFNLTTNTVFVFFLVALTGPIGGASPSRTESESLLQPPDGYNYIEQSELEGLYTQPLDLLSDARQEFKDNKYALAARDIHSAAQLMKVQALVEVKGSHIRETANNLQELSQRVADNEIKSISTLNFELTRAARDEAEYHHLHAAESWAHHMYKNIATDLRAAVNATEKSAEWSGEKLSEGGKKVMAATEALSQKLVSKGKSSEAEIGKGISSLGNEISKLGKEIEPSGKNTK